MRRDGASWRTMRRWGVSWRRILLCKVGLHHFWWYARGEARCARCGQLLYRRRATTKGIG